MLPAAHAPYTVMTYHYDRINRMKSTEQPTCSIDLSSYQSCLMQITIDPSALTESVQLEAVVAYSGRHVIRYDAGAKFLGLMPAALDEAGAS